MSDPSENQMRLVIVGASGMAGGYALRYVLDQPGIGRVAINGMLDDPQAPFGGFKNSGVGREFGTFGIEAFLEPRAIP